VKYEIHPKAFRLTLFKGYRQNEVEILPNWFIYRKEEISLVEDVIWISSKRWNSQPTESLRGLGDLQAVNEFFLFAEKRIQRFDESRFQGGEMKWGASSSEDREFVLIVM